MLRGWGGCRAGPRGHGTAGQVWTWLPEGAHRYWGLSPSHCLLACIFPSLEGELLGDCRPLDPLVAVFTSREAWGVGACLPPKEQGGQ